MEERPQVGYLKLISNRNFLYLFIGQAISNLGDWIVIIALIEIVYRLSGSGLAVGFLIISRVLPALVFSSLAGVIVDRLDRRRVMIFSDIARAFLIVAITLIPSIYWIYLITFLMESFSLLFLPARDASIPNLVGEEELITANSLLYTSNNVAMILGATFGSTIILLVDKLWSHLPFFHRLVGPNVAFYVDSLTFLFSSLFIFLVHLKEKERKGGEFKFELLSQVKEGLRFLSNHPYLRSFFLWISLAILGAGSIYSLGVVYTYEVLKVSSGGFGYLLSALGFGLVLGGLGIGAFGNRFKQEAVVTFSLFLLGVVTIFFALLKSFVISLALAFLGGVSLSFLSVSGYTLVQKEVSDELRGRIFVALETILKVSLLLSLSVTGALADLWDILIKRFKISWQISGAQVIILLGGVTVVIAGLYSLRGGKIEGVKNASAR
jgi:dTMP kinase